jgi:hypothetical protein
MIRSQITTFALIGLTLTACNNYPEPNPNLIIEASGGVYTQQLQPNSSETRLGTAMVVKLRVPLGRTAKDAAVRITGPSGWNQNQPARFTYPAGADWVISPEVKAAPVTGTYDVAVTLANTETPISSSIRFEIQDATTPGALATPIALSNVSRAGASADWADVPGVVGYYARIVNITDGVKDSSEVYTLESQAVIPEAGGQTMDLDPNKAHDVIVYATTLDTVKTDPVLPAVFRVSESVESLQLDTTRARRETRGATRSGFVVRY